MPMTRRVLKKRSKQALVILRRHYPNALGSTFQAERGENYHGVVIRCTHGSGDPCVVEGRPRCACTSHPLKGTPMTGGMSGYYEPEWEERTVLEVLWAVVGWEDRPATMTDREWRRTLAIARVKPFDEAAFIAEMAREDMAYSSVERTR